MKNKKPVLWILNHYAHPPSEPGGTRHYDFARELADEYDVSVFASAYNHRSKESRIAPGLSHEAQVIDGVQFVWVKNIPYRSVYKRVLNMLDFAWKLYSVGKKQEPKPDIIIGSAVHLFTCLSGYFLSKKLGARFFVELRDLWPQTLIDMKVLTERHPLTWLFKKIEKFLYKRAEKIIVLQPYAGEYISGLGINPDKIHFICNGVNAKRFEDWDGVVPDEIQDILKNHQGKFKALYTGAQGKANALDVIVEAARILKERGQDHIDIIMVGDGPEKQPMIELSKKHGLQNIHFYNWVRKDSIPALLKSVDTTIVAMLDMDLYRYGMSLNKVFDYLSCGKPVIFAGRVGGNDVVKESGGGLSIPPANPEAFADAIMNVAAMTQEERDEYGRRGLEYIKEQYDIPVLARKMRSILKG